VPGKNRNYNSVKLNYSSKPTEVHFQKKNLTVIQGLSNCKENIAQVLDDGSDRESIGDREVHMRQKLN